MGIVGVLFLVACLVVVGIGLVLGVVTVVAACALVALGIVSSSTAIALVRRDAGTGFLAFAVQVGAALGLLAGPTIGWVAAIVLYDRPISPAVFLPSGAAGGLVAGVTAGWLVYYGFSTIARWLWDHVEVRPRD